MPDDLSEQCFYDDCDECNWPDCQDDCHHGEYYDLLNGWVDDDDD